MPGMAPWELAERPDGEFWAEWILIADTAYNKAMKALGKA